MIKNDKQILQIKNIFHDVVSISVPAVSGLVHDVYIVECANNKYVCRFSRKIVAEHNLHISNLLNKYGIRAPKISIHDCGGYYCETYPFIPGKTLHERILEGLSGSKLDEVYRQIFDISYKIEKIPYNKFEQISVPLFSSVFRRIVSLLNPSEKKLCHTDLHAKNIILDENDDVVAVVDLDSMLLEYVSVAHFIIMKDAKMYGYDINKFDNISKDVNITCLKALSNIAKIYQKFFSETLRKQILKVRVK